MFWKRRKDSEAVSVKDQEEGKTETSSNVDSNSENKNAPKASTSDGVKDATASRFSLRYSRSSSASMSALSEVGSTEKEIVENSPKADKGEIENANRRYFLLF